MKLQVVKTSLKKRFPAALTLWVQMQGRLARTGVTWRASRLRRADGDIAVSYLTEDFPKPPPRRTGISHGGAVKMVYLAEAFPHSFPAANLLYTVSSVGNPAQAEIVRIAKRRGIQVVLNQNGVAYPAWMATGWEEVNAPMRIMLELADYVIYQSDFCRRSADRFLAPLRVGWEVLFNPVDTRLFHPMHTHSRSRETTLVLGGNQYEQYRFDLAMAALEELLKADAHFRLIVTGRLWKNDPGTLQTVRTDLERRGLIDKVEFVGSYSQQDAPRILNRGDILLHTKNNDPSPGIVSEALACGLPVVYLDSGGTPELVAGAGVGVPVNASWEKNDLPPADRLSSAVLAVLEDYDHFSRAARERAEAAFTLEKYIQAHRRIFSQVSDTR